MDKQDQKELEEFEASLADRRIWSIVGVSLILFLVGFGISFSVFLMISNVIVSFLGG